MDGCVFCAIARGEIPSRRAYENERALVFYDINPQAPTHLVAIPKRHVADLNAWDELSAEEHEALLDACVRAARAAGLTGGYRLVSNCGRDACQSVPHLHFHVLGGAPLSERMV